MGGGGGGFLSSRALWFLLGMVLAILGCLQVFLLLQHSQATSSSSSAAWTSVSNLQEEEDPTDAQNEQLMDQLQALSSEMEAMRLEMEGAARTVTEKDGVPQKRHTNNNSNNNNINSKMGASDDNSPEDEIDDDEDTLILPSNSTIGSCQDILQRMMDWNDCWRRFFWKASSTTDVLDRPIACPILHTVAQPKPKQSVITIIGAPVYHHAYFEGQGFGRVMEHTAETCITAFLLQRPCLVDVTPRDPYYTWRSFVQEGSYRWDPSLLLHETSTGKSDNRNVSYADELHHLIEKLPTKGSNDWEGTIQVSDYERRLVFPMETKFSKTNWKETLAYYYYGTRTQQRGNQVLLAPNWGNAWFSRIPVDTILKERYQCKTSELWTLVENAMYQPTDLTWELHQKRIAKASRTAWKQGLDHATETTAATNNNNNNNIYGSVHIRLYFINENRDARGEPRIDEKELAEILHKCMYRVSVIYKQRNSNNLKDSTSTNTEEFPQKWWFLGDNATMAALVAQEMQDLQRENREPNGKQLPRLYIHHDYNVTTATTNTAKTSISSSSHKASFESKSVYAKAMYGHSFMAGSIEDWMALHQSEVSIVMRQGSFGRSGARGNGKVGGEFCTDKTGIDMPFQIFMKPHRT